MEYRGGSPEYVERSGAIPIECALEGLPDVLTSAGGSNNVDPRQGFVVIARIDPGLRSEPGPKNPVIAKRL